MSFIKIARHQKQVKELFSYTSQKVTLNWLKIVSLSFSISYLIMFIAGGIKIFIISEAPDPTFFPFIGLTFFAFAFSYYGIKQHEIFSESKYAETLTKSSKKYERSGLKETDAQQHLELLLKYLKEEKPFQNSNLTIQDLSKKMNIPRYHLTQIINEQLKKNFYTFINEYRIEEAKKRLTETKYNHYTILAIAYDAGFNSKSTFNTLFKNATGFTPSDFRKRFNKEKADPS